MDDVKVIYRGSLKHKQWKPGDGFGTLCPNWAHEAGGRGFAGDQCKHDWPKTIAQELLATSVVGENGRRFAAMNGIAFEAKETGDGTWHGFPVPWEDVPAQTQEMLITKGQAKWRDIRRQDVDRRDITWALKSDEE